MKTSSSNLARGGEPEGIDTFQAYLSEIGRQPLLTTAQEVNLAKQMEKRLVAEDKLLNRDGMSSAEICRLERDVVLGLEARERLTKANLRLVVYMAKKYVGRGMSLLDLIQEGNIGLIRAVEKFDYRKGFKFSTIAAWWIRHAITHSIDNQGRSARIPVHLVETINRLVRVSSKLEEMKHEDLLPETNRESRKAVISRAQSSAKVDSHLDEANPNEVTLSPADAASFQMLREQVESVLPSLPEPERKVLQLRFGLKDGRVRTLEEVVRQFNVTRERIRQIEVGVFCKLRHSIHTKTIRDFMEL